MTQLDKLYQTVQNLKELGYPLDEKMLADLDRLEESLIEKEVLPALAQTIAPMIGQIQREVTLEVVYIPDEPLSVRLIRNLQGQAREAKATMDALEKEMTEQNPVRKTFTMSPHTKAGKSGLQVKFPDGRIIREKFAYQTLMEVIRHAGYKKVAALDLKLCGVPLVSGTLDDYYGSAQHELEPGVFIMTHSGTRAKADQLETISNHLNLGLEIKIV